MPRKPRQTRSKATVDSIVEAGFLALARHGLSGTTTRHIAEIAGLSVGSLYEYFANKEAVYAAMNERLTEDIVAMIRGLMPTLVRSDIRDLVKILLSNFRDLLNRDDGRYLKYAGYAMRSDHRRNIAPIEKLLTEMVLQYVMHHPELMRLRSLPVMSYILINGGIFTIVRHLAEPNPSITFEELAAGLADMAANHIEVELAKPAASVGATIPVA
ncbi:MAG: TetR/AcrR family transcriptional regulator [Nevskia sp.]